MYKEYRKSLDEFLTYKKAINERVDSLKKDILDKEKQRDNLKNQFTKDFISGAKTDNKELKKINDDIATSKEQLLLIENAIKDDEKLKELSNLVYKEDKELNNKLIEDIGNDNRELLALEKEFEKAKQDIKNRSDERRIINKKLAKQRLEAIEYMDISIQEKNRLSSKATGYQYAQYLQNKAKQ